jgi:hypothetical protein
MWEEENIPCIIPAVSPHIQKAFDSLDAEAVEKMADEIAGQAVAAAVLNADGLPDNTPIKWFRDYSLGLARKVAKGVRGNA